MSQLPIIERAASIRLGDSEPRSSFNRGTYTFVAVEGNGTKI